MLWSYSCSIDDTVPYVRWTRVSSSPTELPVSVVSRCQSQPELEVLLYEHLHQKLLVQLSVNWHFRSIIEFIIYLSIGIKCLATHLLNNDTRTVCMKRSSA